MSLNLTLAIAPTVVIITYILGFDKYNKEPTNLCIKLFVYGCLSVIPAIILETWLDKSEFYSYFSLFKYVFYGVALVEEGIKYVVTNIIAFNHKAFDEYYDGIIYCVMVSLGFATVENINYVLTYGTATALVRAVTAVPAHTIFAVSMGYFIGLAKADPKQNYLFMILALVVPVILHAIYDFIVMANFSYGWILFLIYVLILYKSTIRLIHQTSDIEPFR